MATFPVLALLIYDLIVFLGAISSERKSPCLRDSALISVIFFFAGMPALVYQIVWQRALFAIYGVNAESVAVVVSAFMLGLGLGSLAGGSLSARFPRRAIMLFGVAELGVAGFGLSSLRIFHWASTFTAGASLPYTVVLSLLLLTIPTMLMGASLPLLVEYLVRFSGRVAGSVAMLYFVNTFGSAVACYLCATFLLRYGGQSGSVLFAAILNLLVGATAFFLGRNKQETDAGHQVDSQIISRGDGPMRPLALAMLITGISGFIALGYEMVWFRVFVLASSDRAPAFALLLSTYLAGTAAGSYIAGKVSEGKGASEVLRIIGLVMLIAGAVSPYLPPLVAFLKWKNTPFLLSAVAFFATAALLGAVLPLACKLSVPADLQAGRRVSLVYVSNILGSTLGSLSIGLVQLNHFGLRDVSLQLGACAALTGSVVFAFGCHKSVKPPVWAIATVIVAIGAIPIASRFYLGLFERLIFGGSANAIMPLAKVVENRYGVVAITREGAVWGGGVYDGYFNIDPMNDTNMIMRAFALSAFEPAPKRILEIGLSSGSWAQVLVNQPGLQSLEIVEINPGYLQLIGEYAMVRSILQNPKVNIIIDDGRRWLLAHPDARYDAIVQNTSFYWRDHTSNLLSVDYLQIIRQHLNPGGVFYFNTTGSDDVIATGLHVFPFGLRVVNFLAVSDSPITIDKDHWMSTLRQYKIDGYLVFDPTIPKSETTLMSYMLLADSMKQAPTLQSIETATSLNARLGKRLIITDDNMGSEWWTGESNR